MGCKTQAVLPQRISGVEEGTDLFQKPAVHRSFLAAHSTVQEDPEISAGCSQPPETRTCYKAGRISLKKKLTYISSGRVLPRMSETLWKERKDGALILQDQGY